MPDEPQMSLREITMDNFHECIRLPLSEQYRSFVASNMCSLEEAKADGVSVPLTIYAGETMVGFIMYWYDAPTGRGYIDRLMITTDQQGKGYGTFALKPSSSVFVICPVACTSKFPGTWKTSVQQRFTTNWASSITANSSTGKSWRS